MRMDFSHIFRQRGLSFTAPRKQILESLTPIPMTIQDVLERLEQKNNSVDPATVFRTLELLTSLGITAKTQFEDKAARYELVMNQKHHHHLICEKCGSIEDVPLKEEVFLKQIEASSTFKVTKHTLEFFGFCLRCQ